MLGLNGGFELLELHLNCLLEDVASSSICLANDDFNLSCEPSTAGLTFLNIERLLLTTLPRHCLAEEFAIQIVARHAKDLLKLVVEVLLDSETFQCGRRLL